MHVHKMRKQNKKTATVNNTYSSDLEISSNNLI